MTTNNQRKPKRWELYRKEWQIPDLCTDEPVGLYPRQSTERQTKKNRQSFESQTFDAVDDLVRRGWTDRSLIKVYDQDMGTSAARAFEEREALNQMLADIREKVIRTVKASEVDRLFRDEDRIDSNWFIKVCREANCLVLTDRAIYDFSIPRHVKYFRDEVDRAWEYYESQILIRAHMHQDRARSQGLHAGGPVLVGYIVDKNEKSPTYKKYTPYQPMAQRSLEIFQWLYDFGGIIGLLAEKLDSLPYVFPLEEQWVRDQRAFSTNLEVVYGTELDEDGNPVAIGYRFSRKGLMNYLQHRGLIGDWKYGDEWIPNNHLPIIPRDLFDFAQEAIHRTSEASVRNYHTFSSSVVHDILYAGPEGTKRYVVRNHDAQAYRIVERDGLKTVILGSISIEDIECEFLLKFTERLRETDRFENYQQHLVSDEQSINRRKENLKGLISELTEQIDGLFLTLKSPKLEEKDRGEYIVERRKLIERRERLEKELSIQSPMQTYLKYKDLITLMGKYWDRYPLEDRQSLVALLVKRVYLEPLTKSFMKLTIVWKAFPEDVGIIWRGESTAQFKWTPEEEETLRRVYPTESHYAILNALPNRSWASIKVKAQSLSLRRQANREATPFNYNLSMADMAIIEQYGIPLDAITQSRTANLSLFAIWDCGSHKPNCPQRGRSPRNNRKECHALSTLYT